MADTMVLSEDEVLELLAFFLTSARILQREPAQYGSMRLLMAAERVGEFALERSSPDTQEFLVAMAEDLERALTYMADSERFVADMDAMCRKIAQYLVERDEAGGDA
jgi:hypothetical protein